MARARRLPKAPVQPVKKVDFDRVLSRLAELERPVDTEFLTRVYDFSERVHRDQRRRSGEPYVTHPVYVSYILADLKFDQTCVAVGLLHDVLEDTLTTREVLEEEFGADVAELVDGVTKIGKQAYVRRDEAQAETFRKMILASARDLRVILVKIADRLHNMMTLEHMSPEARGRISRETLEIYAPISLRLGMAKVQGDLEDLAFYHLYPRQFAELESKVREKLRVGKGATQRISSRLQDSLTKGGIDVEISFRVKRYYSIYRKLLRQGIDISQLYDYLAFRIITESVQDTYVALGTVHQNWRPIPGRFKDYIAMPKPNLYQSLHTTVVGSTGQPFEVQIRTQEMDLVAEEGIAAHWHYKSGDGGTSSSDPNILWLRQLLEWQKDVEDPRTFLSTLKLDLYPDEVYVFTPKGDVFAFPRGATPLDFAYRIHTDLGHQCSGARLNGKLVPLKSKLQNGDMVEVMTSPNRKPSRDWLTFVKTSRAKSKIRNWLNTQQKLESQAIGKRLFERELKRLKMSLKRALDSPRLEEYLKSEGLGKIEEVWERIGYGKTAVRAAVSRIVEQGEGESEVEGAKLKTGALRRVVDRFLPFGTGPVQVKGEGDFMTSLAKCCNPVPGEELVGYVTRGRGISVHSAECSNIANLMFDPERLIEVEWSRQVDKAYPVSLSIKTLDNPGMLARLTEVIAKESSNIRQCEAGTSETGEGIIDLVVEVRNRRHLDRLHKVLSAIDGVLDVGRRISRVVARP